MGRRGNPNWGKPVPSGPVVPTVTSFEEAVKELELQPDQYLHSTRGELLRRLGRPVEARAAYERALELASSEPERRFLERRIAEL